ncbi:MAG: DUF4136 domain-containing protein [Halioglobus sp.]
MQITRILTSTLLSLLLIACSGVEIQQSGVEQFSAGNYHYYRWRTAPLPQETRSTDPLYSIDPVIRQEVNALLQAKGYVLDPERAQFTVDYLYVSGVLQGERSEMASNIKPYPMVLPNRQIDQASVDNAIALGGVKETNNIIVQFNNRASNQEVWRVTLTKIVEDANNVDSTRLDTGLKHLLERALEPLPPASQP